MEEALAQRGPPTVPPPPTNLPPPSPPTPPNPLKADRVERFVVVHGQILLNQFKHFPNKAVQKAAFVGELKQRMEARKHMKLYMGKVRALLRGGRWSGSFLGVGWVGSSQARCQGPWRRGRAAGQLQARQRSTWVGRPGDGRGRHAELAAKTL
jgi:hypothetical protein